MLTATCRMLGQACTREQLPDDEHVLVHAAARMVMEVFDEDRAAGVLPGTNSSILGDGHRLKRILDSEGWYVANRNTVGPDDDALLPGEDA